MTTDRGGQVDPRQVIITSLLSSHEGQNIEDNVVATLRPDLVLGLVAPVGTDLQLLHDVLKQAVDAVGYDLKDIHVSDLIDRHSGEFGVTVEPGSNRYDRLMRLGTALRKAFEDGAVPTILAIAAIREIRSQIGKGPTVYLIRSVKHPAEVQTLRSVYGSTFLLVGATAEYDDRLTEVSRQLTIRGTTERDAKIIAVELLNRDEAEQDENTRGGETRENEVDIQPDEPLHREEVERHETHPVREAQESSREMHHLGQQVQDTFPLADVFFDLSVRRRKDLHSDVVRFVELLFGNPYHTPTKHELAMFHAHAASMRSSDLGRQVGCAIVDDDGEVLTTGTNEVAKAYGGQYWPTDPGDARDFTLRLELRDKLNRHLVLETLTQLREAGWLGERLMAFELVDLASLAMAKGGPLEKSRLLDLMEFGRTVHAEMAALMTAARRGTSIKGAALYSTTFPCHECARHIVAAGITRVTYREPYPKSRVNELYPDSIVIDVSSDKHRIQFTSFVGIAPRMFLQLFEALERKDELGDLEVWAGRQAPPRIAEADLSAEEFIQSREQNLLADFAQRAKAKSARPT